MPPPRASVPQKPTLYITDAPTENPHKGQRGMAIDGPYNREFQGRLKQLPDWTWEWRPDEEVWVVDLMVWEWVKELLKEEFDYYDYP